MKYGKSTGIIVHYDVTHKLVLINSVLNTLLSHNNHTDRYDCYYWT